MTQALSTFTHNGKKYGVFLVDGEMVTRETLANGSKHLVKDVWQQLEIGSKITVETTIDMKEPSCYSGNLPLSINGGWMEMDQEIIIGHNTTPVGSSHAKLTPGVYDLKDVWKQFQEGDEITIRAKVHVVEDHDYTGNRSLGISGLDEDPEDFEWLCDSDGYQVIVS